MYSLMALYIHQKNQLMWKKGNFANYTGSSFRQHDENVEHLLKTTVTEQPRCLGIMFCYDMFCKLKNSDFRLKCSLLNEYVARNSKGNFFSPQRQHLGTKLTKQKMTLMSRYKGQLGNTSHKKNRFLLGIARKGEGGGPCPNFLTLFFTRLSLIF